MSERKKSKNGSALQIEGELSIYRAAELKPLLLDPLLAGRSLEVDLGGVSEFDTSGVQLLLVARRTALLLGTELKLKGHSARVREVLQLLNLSAYLDAEAV